VWGLTGLARHEQAQSTDGSQGFRATAQFRAAEVLQSPGSEPTGEYGKLVRGGWPMLAIAGVGGGGKRGDEPLCGTR